MSSFYQALAPEYGPDTASLLCQWLEALTGENYQTATSWLIENQPSALDSLATRIGPLLYEDLSYATSSFLPDLLATYGKAGTLIFLLLADQDIPSAASYLVSARTDPVRDLASLLREQEEETEVHEH